MITKLYVKEKEKRIQKLILASNFNVFFNCQE